MICNAGVPPQVFFKLYVLLKVWIYPASDP